MVKYIKEFCLLLVFTIFLSGCGAGDKSPEPIRDTDSKIGNVRDVSLTVIVPEYTENSRDFWNNFKKEFEEENKDITLFVECFEWDKINRAIDIIVSSKAYPDVVLSDIAPVPSDEEEEPLVTEERPVFASRRKLLVNKEILSKNGIDNPPESWKELLEDLRTIKNGTGEIPFGLSLLDEEALFTFACFCLNSGGGFMEEEGNWYLDSSLNAYALEFEKRLIESGYTNPNPANTSVSELSKLFLDGEVAMMIAPDMLFEAVEEDEENYEFIDIPTYGEKESVTLLSKESFYTLESNIEDTKKRKLREDALERFYTAFFEKETFDSYVKGEGKKPYLESDGLEKVFSFPVEASGWDIVKQGIIDIQRNLFDVGESIDALSRLQEDLLLYLNEQQ